MRIIASIANLLTISGLALYLAACTSTSQSPPDLQLASASGGSQTKGLQLVPNLPPPVDTNNGQDVPIAPNDQLEIDVFQVPDLNRTVQVDNNGSISLPLVGEVKAAGKTVLALQNEITQRYGAKYLQNPQVSVLMKQSAGQQVTVDGSVTKPGIYPIAGNSTLLQVIAEAGGLDKMADESKIYVFRQVGARKLVANYDVKEIRQGHRPDPRIYGGDIVVSFKSGSKVAMQNLGDVLGILGRGAYIGVMSGL
jgi:polysaccharide export outer membrane protein